VPIEDLKMHKRLEGLNCPKPLGDIVIFLLFVCHRYFKNSQFC